MDHSRLAAIVRQTVTAMAFCLLPSLAAAQTAPAPDLSGMSLEDLLAAEVVSTASKFPQAVTEAPASVTVITGEEIRRHGHRTLAETLRSVRGFYTTYDRNYTYIGMRGFARPGDYNTRVLLLLDGHRLNDDIYNQAPMGTDFPIDLSLIERIEVIRGPGSSLYGTSAFFAVINVVTKTGADRQGVQSQLQGGSLTTAGATGSYGRLFDGGRELLVAGSTYRSNGQHRLSYPEFKGVGSGDGLALGLDDDKTSSAFASLSMGRFSFRAGVSQRDKQVPTASFLSVFGDDREATTDNRVFASGVYDGPLGRGWMGTARLAYDFYGYEGTYPFDYGDDGIVLWEDESAAQTVTGEITARRRLGHVHLLTVGTEVRGNLQNHQVGRDLFGDIVDANRPGTNAAVYAQDEMRPLSWLLINAGVRLDRYSRYGVRATPRAGLVLLPRRQTAVKLLYGEAFRAPNPYEREYFNGRMDLAPALTPEHVRSSELVWEELFSKHFRTTVTVFDSDVRHLIEQRPSESDEVEMYFENAGHTHGRGVETEAEIRLSGGVSARVSQSFVRVSDEREERMVSNAPRHLSKLSLDVPVSRAIVALDGQYVSERLTLGGEPLAGFFVPNVTVSAPLQGRWRFGFSIYNMFNQQYADPGAEEHVQPSIRQDGRTMLLRVHFGR